MLNPANPRHMGSLSPDEQAVVIVDVDPIHTVDTRPSLQLPIRPIEYVAHLPIFEAARRESDSFPRPWGAPRGPICRCGQLGPISEVGEKLAAIVASAHRQEASQGVDWSKETQRVARTAHEAELTWVSLRERLACWDAHQSADRGGHPPPTMMDWLWVPGGTPSAPTATTDIYVSAYSTPPGTPGDVEGGP